MPASIAAGLTTLTHATDIVAAPETSDAKLAGDGGRLPSPCRTSMSCQSAAPGRRQTSPCRKRWRESSCASSSRQRRHRRQHRGPGSASAPSAPANVAMLEAMIWVVVRTRAAAAVAALDARTFFPMRTNAAAMVAGARSHDVVGASSQRSGKNRHRRHDSIDHA